LWKSALGSKSTAICRPSFDPRFRFGQGRSATAVRPNLALTRPQRLFRFERRARVGSRADRETEPATPAAYRPTVLSRLTPDRRCFRVLTPASPTNARNSARAEPLRHDAWPHLASVVQNASTPDHFVVLLSFALKHKPLSQIQLRQGHGIAPFNCVLT
jgi:hypothetical protein